MRFTVPFQLLEINVISAQELSSVSRSMQTYAVAWVHPDRKLTTRVDQTGQSNPSWNEKFVFRVDNDFLESEDSTIMVEIYKVAWLKKDSRVGTVSVLISNILPQSVRDERSSDMHYITLQVRRPSGRPQGILNLGVALLDNTLRSMPLYTEPVMPDPDPSPGGHLRRTNSDLTDRTTDPQRKASSAVNHGSIVHGGSMVNGSVIGVHKTKGGSVISDIGPSASIVAAAISKGIYPVHTNPPNNNRQNDGGSLILENWNEKDTGADGLKTKIERWRTEFPPVYDYQRELENERRRELEDEKLKKRTHQRRRTVAGNGLFSCFGNAYGIEFTITCGGPQGKKRVGGGSSTTKPQPSDRSENTYSMSYV